MVVEGANVVSPAQRSGKVKGLQSSFYRSPVLRLQLVDQFLEECFVRMRGRSGICITFSEDSTAERGKPAK